MLVDSLLENDALGLLVHRLSAFDEKVGRCSSNSVVRIVGWLRKKKHAGGRGGVCAPRGFACFGAQAVTMPMASAAELPSAARAAHLQVAEEASAVYNVLAIIENLIEVKPAIAEQVVEKTKVREIAPAVAALSISNGRQCSRRSLRCLCVAVHSPQSTAKHNSPLLQLLKWLLARLRPRETDSNKQYASEILAILVQQSGEPFCCSAPLFAIVAVAYASEMQAILVQQSGAFQGIEFWSWRSRQLWLAAARQPSSGQSWCSSQEGAQPTACKVQHARGLHQRLSGLRHPELACVDLPTLNHYQPDIAPPPSITTSLPCCNHSTRADANKRKMGATSGIDAVLQAIAPYRNR